MNELEVKVKIHHLQGESIVLFNVNVLFLLYVSLLLTCMV